jgi:hypothetical protein
MAKNVKYVALIIGLAFSTTSCGVYYKKEVYTQSKHVDGWRSVGEYSVYDCGKGAITTTGLLVRDSKYDSMLGMPVPIPYGKEIPIVWLSIKGNATRSNTCELGFLWLSNDGRQIKPVAVKELQIEEGPGAGLYCTYRFGPDSILDNVTSIEFNSELAKCSINKLSVQKDVKHGYKNVPFQ